MGDVAMTVSFSAGSDSEVTPEHQKRLGELPMNCERELVDRNICIFDGGNLKEHFNGFFKECRDEYNAKQKRNDRKVSDDYYEAVKNQTETYGKGDKAEKAVYHDIIQIGNRSNNGITNDDFDNNYYLQLKKQGKLQEASDYCLQHLNAGDDLDNTVNILKNIGERLVSDEFPNIVVHSAYIHLDEPNGTPHLDIIYSVVALDEKRGPQKRVSMNKGFLAMGYKYQADKTQFEQFRDDIKDDIGSQMQAVGIEREVLNESRERIKTHRFKAGEAKALEAEKEKQEALTRQLEEEKTSYKEKALVNYQFYNNEFGKLDEFKAEMNERLTDVDRAVLDLKATDDEAVERKKQELLRKAEELQAVELPEYAIPEDLEEEVIAEAEHLKAVNKDYEEMEHHKKAVEAENEPVKTSKPLPKKLTTKEELEAQRRAMQAFMDDWNEDAEVFNKSVDNELKNL